ncbi:type II secretion system F family protein [Vibrio sp. SM6]|uniref:Type II secretion system F family protein n=1 Tax=Vibrio agarilyticus TaxID=2726741 RepID=A0A7X8TS37_9VIBR|nr:type II secretion system F family protein [Vibrio agarilyticus]NLS13785.1 type II secretion system F family protein [Vibrio agarilyticus]
MTLNVWAVFGALLAVFVGIVVLGYLVWQNFGGGERNRIREIFDDEPQQNEEKPIEIVFNQLLASFATKEDDVKLKLEEAGLQNEFVAKYYMHIKYGVMLIGLFAIYLVVQRMDLTTNHSIIAMVAWFLFCIIAPDSFLAGRKTKRQYKISSQLPYLLDLMAICVQTGMTLEATLKYLSLELRAFDKDLAKLLAKVDDRANIVGLERALDELYNKVPTSEIRSFVMTLKQSLQYGSSIYSVLTTLAADIRDINMLASEERIGKLAAKMSLPLILFIMMPIVVIILAPAASRFMSHV